MTTKHAQVFLAGDAAHEMPPFLGQGMCSGIRDAINLAWKLDLVLSGRTDDTMLDSYHDERAPHVKQITLRAIELGRLQTIRDADQARARARDERMRQAQAESGEPAAYAFPAYEDGFLSSSRLGHGREVLFPQGDVQGPEGIPARFDDVVGSGFHIVTTDEGALAGLPTPRGADVCLLRDPAGSEQRSDDIRSLVDMEGVYAQWFADHRCDSGVVRPDG